MSLLLECVAAVLMFSVALGLVRIWRGPTLADRMLAAQLFGTTGVALLIVFAELQRMPALRDVGLVLAVLALMAVLAFVSRVWGAERETDGLDEAAASTGDRSLLAKGSLATAMRHGTQTARPGMERSNGDS